MPGVGDGEVFDVGCVCGADGGCELSETVIGAGSEGLPWRATFGERMGAGGIAAVGEVERVEGVVEGYALEVELAVREGDG